MSIDMIILASVVLLLILALLPLLIKRTIVATITGFSWARTIFLEHYVWVEETSYSGFPEDSRNQRSEIETYYSYEVVRYNTITTTQADGTSSTTTQPVFGNVRKKRTKYTYEIQRWVESRVLHSEGTKHNTVYWPNYIPDHRTQERINKTKEAYMVFFQTVKGKEYTQKLAQDIWTDLDENAEYDLRVNLYGRITKSPTLHTVQKAAIEPEPMQQKMS